MELVAVDIGGTHTRFSLARISDDGLIKLGDPVTLQTTDFVTLQSAWARFAGLIDGEIPRAAAIAVAGPVSSDVVRLTNNPWVLNIGRIPEQLGLDRVTVINDFEAVAHAVANAGPDQFEHLAGPAEPLPAEGTISVIGPGTGLGVAYLRREASGDYHVQATEGGHIDFAPLDAIDDILLGRLRERYRRVSVERVVSGPAIVDIYQAMAAIEGKAINEYDDRTLWQLGVSGENALAAAAVDRFCLSLGAVAGDIALAHGAGSVVIAGGLGYRIREVLLKSGFGARFCAKGRYESMMAAMPVKLITHPQPGLFGAAAAYAREYFC